MARSIKEVHTINYYPINEGAARRAKEMNSFSDYKEGSATAEYRAMVDKAAAIAEKQKSRVDPMYHEKIDHLLDTYARKLAENMNQGFAIDARVPSVMIAGPANFPVGKKEKQNGNTGRQRKGSLPLIKRTPPEKPPDSRPSPPSLKRTRRSCAGRYGRHFPKLPALTSFLPFCCVRV